MLEYIVKTLSEHNLFTIFLDAFQKSYTVSSTKGGYLFKIKSAYFSQDDATINLFYAALTSR